MLLIKNYSVIESNPLKVLSTDKETLCRCCRINLSELGNFEFIGNYSSSSRFKEEYCACKRCGEGFILHYDFFDLKGHVQRSVFTQDINDPEYNWQNSLTRDQVSTVEKHLKECSSCSRLLNEEMLTDAWFGSIMHQENSKFTENRK